MELVHFEISLCWFWGPWLACHKEYQRCACQPPHYRFPFPLSWDRRGWFRLHQLNFALLWMMKEGFNHHHSADSHSHCGNTILLGTIMWVQKKKWPKKHHKSIVERMHLPDRLHYHCLLLWLGFGHQKSAHCTFPGRRFSLRQKSTSCGRDKGEAQSCLW